eukprot:TRINITY_DN35790_c0_g1_i1.p1 TRINITY_DN35790_c0_g1~~TRINITY_DN35790_c0_g1_i1.p1  ORF type:complete len:399 (-),score=73.15 TRINITY_DN35790_c0_g1_i1:96-1292(-)
MGVGASVVQQEGRPAHRRVDSSPAMLPRIIQPTPPKIQRYPSDNQMEYASSSPKMHSLGIKASPSLDSADHSNGIATSPPRFLSPLSITSLEKAGLSRSWSPASPLDTTTTSKLSSPTMLPHIVSDPTHKARHQRTPSITSSPPPSTSPWDIFEDQPSVQDSRQALSSKLSVRPEAKDLVARNILKGSVSGNILSAQLSLQFNIVSDSLGPKLAKRPHREWLLQNNILKEHEQDARERSHSIKANTLRTKLRVRLSEVLSQEEQEHESTHHLHHGVSSPIIAVSAPPDANTEPMLFSPLLSPLPSPHSPMSLSPSSSPSTSLCPSPAISPPTSRSPSPLPVFILSEKRPTILPSLGPDAPKPALGASWSLGHEFRSSKIISNNTIEVCLSGSPKHKET